jgi:hypothetical protein
MAQPIGVGVDANWSVDFGQICDGETVTIKLCNSDGGTHTATIQVCGCPNFDFPTSETLDACECKDITATFTGSGFPNTGNCLIIITFNGKKSLVNVRWEEVYCAPTIRTWTLEDTNNLVTISDTDFNPNCDIFTAGCMAETKTIKMTLTIPQPIIAGDVLYL